MLNMILLAMLQAATEFLPLSSSGHLAIFANLFSKPDLFFFTVLHASSLIAVLIFTRHEIKNLLTFRPEYKKMWLYLLIATIPAGFFGFFFRKFIEGMFSSMFFIGAAYLFTATVLFFTRYAQKEQALNTKNAIIIGIFQVLGLFPGVSRSGVTISTALFLGIEREKAAKFSFLLFIPLSVGALLTEAGEGFYFSASLLIAFITCLVLSVLFLKLVLILVKKERFWLFSIYCFLMGLVSVFIYYKK